nr:glycosyltransferase [Paenibacillus sp. NEAU-GSW1]
MIVKDEEAFLPACLDSVQGIADEIIIVDTGSSDKTVAIAESRNAVIVNYAWDHDFAKARNAGLELAQGEWILFLDADEQLDAATKEQLLEHARNPELSALLLQIRNVVGDGEGQGATIHPVLRMFRNDRRIRFEGRIHEQIAAAVLRVYPGAAFFLTEAVIRHYGYRPQVIEAKSKLKRNMDLLKRAIAEDPGNGFHRYNIGVEHLRAGNPAEALEAFRLARKAVDFETLNYAHLVIKYESLSLQMMGRWQEAEAVAAEGAARYPAYTDMWHYRSLALAELGRLHEARAAAEQAIRLGVSPPDFHTEDGLGTFRTAYLLGRLCEALQDDQSVLQAYVLALQLKSSLLPPLFRLCAYFRASGQEELLTAALAARLHCPDEGAIVKLAGVMAASGCHDAALSWLARHASAAADDSLRLSLSERLKRLQEGDSGGLPFAEQWQAAREGSASGADGLEMPPAAGEWRSRADRWLEKEQLERRSAIEKRAVTAIRLYFPLYEGW